MSLQNRVGKTIRGDFLDGSLGCGGRLSRFLKDASLVLAFTPSQVKKAVYD